jgi:hypothetical protein
MKKLIILLLVFVQINCDAQENKTSKLSTENKSQPYPALVYETSEKRKEYKELYISSIENQKDSIVKDAQAYLLNISDLYFKAWYKTPWSFSGHTKTPQKGSIACGYFVTTTLSDMGLNIPRVYWAQQTSEYMIKKMTTDIKRFHKRPMSEVIEYLKTKGEGLYVVGLDCHVGYIYYINGKMNFVHSNYYQPQIGVMSEPLVGRNPLNDSKYKVIGKIFDKKMVLNWILGTKYSQ